jgi:hypothetical protein
MAAHHLDKITVSGIYTIKGTLYRFSVKANFGGIVRMFHRDVLSVQLKDRKPVT